MLIADFFMLPVEFHDKIIIVILFLIFSIIFDTLFSIEGIIVSYGDQSRKYYFHENCLTFISYRKERAVRIFDVAPSAQAE